MTAEIIDQANELAQQRIDMAIASTATPYQLSIVVNVAIRYLKHGGKLTLAAPCALVALKSLS